MQRLLIGGLFAAACLASAPALAKPAKCLLVSEGKKVIDGPCDIRTDDADGSFSVTAGKVTANILVDPGSKEGRVFYEDPTGPWVLGDVTRSGACWGNKQGKLCAWAAEGKPAQAAAGPQGAAEGAATGVKPGVFQRERGLGGGWTLLRFSRDEGGRDLLHCTLFRMTGSEQGISFAFDDAAGTWNYGFAALGTAASKEPMKVTLWFDGDTSTSRTVTAELLAEADGFEWRGVRQPRGQSGLEDAFMNARSVSFGYSFEGRRSVTFPLKGADAALKQLFDCRRN